MKKLCAVLLALSLIVAAGAASAANYIEDFEATFPAWESGWFGTNSNARNYYGVGQDRGNNPDGLWISDNDGNAMNAVIKFAPAFGATLTSFAIDVAGWQPARLQVFDMANTMIFDQQITLTQGAYTDPGTYAHYAVTSGNGISGFSFIADNGGQVEGNTGIDNVFVSTNAVPLPPSLLLLAPGIVGLAAARRRFRK